ncbi:uncharacterized protein LOC122950431 [Acropora millepora]|uniref:uncharacterized protein LOC122950431 n=1 Tax=Acropora millepora TaxID=45264 RepID=UPI001CF2AD9B|nr:uncharacterized protein LOC122950431 [Acropora millepora]
MSCLYAAIPSVVLEVLSLGAILVTPRTQELNLQIPLFCCNVSEDKEDRKRKIDEMLTRAIADLQDMAKSPGIRDPDLNTAECVIQGHKPNIDAPGVSPYIKPILWCSFFFVLLLGPIVTFIVFDLLENKPGKEKSANVLCYFLLPIEICVEKSKGNFLQPCLTIPAIFLSLCLVAVITVLAGQSFNGRETTNVVMKTALLYVVGGISWMLKKDLSTSSHQNNPNPNQNNQGNLDLDEGDPFSSGSSNAIHLEAMGASSDVKEEEESPLASKV